MPYNASGVYTRVANSFSTPVTGTTIDPADADTYFDDIDSALNAYYGTSTTSVAIATGSQTFTTQADKLFTAGRFVMLISSANSANYMFGQVTSYVSTSLVVNVLATGGSGTHADWTISLSGGRGADGKAAGHSYVWSTSTSGDPGSGKLLGNNATISSVTAINISETDNDGNSIASNIATWDDGTSTIHGRLKIYDPVTPTNYAYFDITGTNTDAGTYDTLNVSYVGSGGTLSSGLGVAVLFIPKGDKGDTGATGNATFSGATQHGVLIASGATTATSTAVMTTGQILVGSTGADPVPTSPATSAQYQANTSGKYLTTDQVWAAAAEVALTDAATIALDLSTGINFAVTLGGNRTLGNPTNTKVGQSGYIRIAQDGTGSRTLAYGGNWKFPGASAPVLTTTASKVDYLYYMVRSSTEIVGSLVRNVG